MILYLDTSVLVAALTPEAATRRVQHWISTQGAETVAVSEWVGVEFPLRSP